MPTCRPCGAQPRLLLGEEAAIADHVERLVEHGLVIAAVVFERREILIDQLVVVGECIGRNEIAPPDVGAVEFELVRGDVHEPLDHEHAVLAAGAAVGRHDRLVGEDSREGALVIFDHVRTEDRDLAVDRHGQPIGIVRAGVVQERVLDAEDAPVARERDLGVVDLRTLLRRGEEMLEPVFDPLDRAVEFFRRPGDHHLLGVEQHDLRPEAAADERRNHAHLPLVEAEHRGEPVAQEHRPLCRVPHRELVAAGVPVGDDAARLDRRRRAVVVAEAASDDVVGAGAGGRVIAAALPHVRGDIAAHVLVHASRGLGAGLFQIDDRRQRIELDGDVGQCVLGEIAALRQHDRQGLADVAHLAFGERHLRALVEDEPGDRRWRHEQRPRRPVRAEILRRIDGDDALARPRRGNVDRADRGVGEVAAQESRMQHAGKLDVVDEQRLTAQQPRVLVASDRSAEIPRGHGSAPQPFGGQRDRRHDVLVAGAAAKVSGERFADLRLVRLRRLVEKDLHGHQDAGRAIAALEAVTVAHRFLQRMQAVALRREPLDRRDRVTIGLRREHQAGTHRGAVEDHRAGSAYAVLAADVSAREQQVMAQEIAQQRARLDLTAVGRAVHRHGDLVSFSAHARARSFAQASARAVSTPAMWR